MRRRRADKVRKRLLLDAVRAHPEVRLGEPTALDLFLLPPFRQTHCLMVAEARSDFRCRSVIAAAASRGGSKAQTPDLDKATSADCQRTSWVRVDRGHGGDAWDGRRAPFAQGGGMSWTRTQLCGAGL